MQQWNVLRRDFAGVQDFEPLHAKKYDYDYGYDYDKDSDSQRRCPRRESNPHAAYAARDFKHLGFPGNYADFAILGRSCDDLTISEGYAEGGKAVLLCPFFYCLNGVYKGKYNAK